MRIAFVVSANVTWIVWNVEAAVRTKNVEAVQTATTKAAVVTTTATIRNIEEVDAVEDAK